MKTIRQVQLKWKRVQLAMEAPAVYESKVITSKDAVKVIRALIGDEVTENFLVLLMTTKNQVLGFDIVSKGGIASCSITPADVFRGAIAAGATHIILAHNHPSGFSSPSDEDIGLTRRLTRAGELLGIDVLDHIIVAEDGYYSLCDSGLLNDLKKSE